MRRLHGPFDHRSPSGKRESFREKLREKVEAGMCRCGLCDPRVEAGKDPNPWPETPCWTRLNPPGEELPVMERPVYLCDRAGVGLEAGA